MDSSLYGQCAKCSFTNTDKVCRNPNSIKRTDFCSMELYKEVLEDSANAYDKVMHFAAEASRQEISCYFPSYYNSNINMAIKPRIVETIELCQRMGYKKIGLAFCGGLQKEAFMLIKVLEAENLEIVSVMCKIGGKDKTCLGLAPDEKINKNSTHESMCNPIGQAAILNREKTEFNLVLGLCVGHDSLFLKHSDALCTVIAVKDRVTGHNPLVTLYTMDSYYRYMK